MSPAAPLPPSGIFRQSPVAALYIYISYRIFSGPFRRSGVGSLFARSAAVVVDRMMMMMTMSALSFVRLFVRSFVPSFLGSFLRPFVRSACSLLTKGGIASKGFQVLRP